MGDEGDVELRSDTTRVAVPQFGWKVKLDHVFPERRDPHIVPTLKQLVALLPLSSRYLWYVMKIYKAKRKPLMDYLKMVTGRQIYGVPLGGLGCGTIGRGFKGEFCRYQLKPGVYEYALVHANQFIITIQSTDKKILYQKVLSSCQKPNGCLGTWNWQFEGSNAEYCGLYPRAWTVFHIPEHKIRVTCRQISPVIPRNYKDSSIPGAAFVWLIENNSEEDKHISITFTFKNGNGTKEDKAGGCWSEAFQANNAKGVLIHQKIGGMPCTYAISANAEEDVNVSHMVHFDPNGNGKELWDDLQQCGELSSLHDRSEETKKGKQLASAVCAKITVPKSLSRQLKFALAWDMPKIHFHGKAKEYYRYYTKYFGREGNSAPVISSYIFDNYKSWEDEIEAWQEPILSDLNLPDWYKSALFNELYYVSDGGSVWLDMDLTDSKYQNDPRKEYGQYAYLEGHELRHRLPTMAKLALPLLLFLACWASASALGANRVVCYLDGSAFRRPEPHRLLVSEIEPSLSYCTHLIYGYARIDTDSYKAVVRHEGEGTNYTSVVALKRRFPALNILLSIGGGSADSGQREKYLHLLESDDHRRTFVKSVKDLLIQYHFDGIDIAWEFPKNKEKKDRGTFGSIWHGFKKVIGLAHSHKDDKADEHRREFSSLIHELKTSLKSENALLTLSVIPYINHTLYYDCSALSPDIDQLHLLAYDYHTPQRTPKKADYPAPLYAVGKRDPYLSADGNVRWFLERGFPSRKIVLGIPTFARTWKLDGDSRVSGVPPIEADGAGDTDSVANEAGIMAYQTVCMLLPNAANAAYKTTLSRVTDPTERLGSYGFRLPSGDVNGLWVGYEDPDVADYKAQYAKIKSLGGVAFSDLSLDDYHGICTGNKFPIVRAGTLRLRYA